MINPQNSIWNKPKKVFIKDKILWYKWVSIKQHIITNPRVVERYGYLEIMDCCYIAKNSMKMRLKSHLDWCYYTPQTLAQAIDSNSLESYYEIMLKDIRSDPNIWKDRNLELELKSYYAARAGRASLI